MSISLKAKLHLKTLFLAFAQLCLVSADVLNSYPTMRKIAGLSAREDQNFWIDSYEGADPLSVELSNPHDCGTDVYGRIYIVDKESHSILRVSADGSTLTTVAGTHSLGNASDLPQTATTGALFNPNGLFVFADGSFLILDTDNRKVRKVSAEGIMETVFQYPAGFGSGRGLVANSSGTEIYFCGEITTSTSQAVKRWTTDAGFTTVAEIDPGERGLGNLDLGPDGSLYVTSSGDHRVFQIPPGGTPIVVAGNGTTNGPVTDGALATSVSLDRARGIAVLPDGTFFVAAQKGGDIWWVDNGPANDGIARRIHLFVNGARSGNINSGDDQPRTGISDRIAEPRAIHLATNGDLLITCNDTGYIRAVRNVCKPTAPSLQLNGSTLTWDANWQETFAIETSPTMKDGSWTFHSGTTSQFTGQESMTIDTSQSGFIRLTAPQVAGGE